MPEAREMALFAGLLERRGAEVLRCPLVAIKDVADPTEVLQWIEQFIDPGLDDLILTTGEGLRRLLGYIEQHRPALRPAFVTALKRTRLLARGPKPGRMLQTLALQPQHVADPATTTGLIAMLGTLHAQQPLTGRRIGVQRYGSEINPPLMSALAEWGAIAVPVAPYRYADAADDVAVQQLIAALMSGQVDAIAFTSLSQVERLTKVAAAQDCDLAKVLARTCVAAVGPVVAERLQSAGVSVAVMPGRSWYLKPLTSALSEALSLVA